MSFVIAQSTCCISSEDQKSFHKYSIKTGWKVVSYVQLHCLLQVMIQFSKTVYSMLRCWSGGYQACQAYSSATTVPAISLSLCAGQRNGMDNKKTQPQGPRAKGLEFDLNTPLKQALKSVSYGGGTMMLTFPNASQVEVSI